MFIFIKNKSIKSILFYFLIILIDFYFNFYSGMTIRIFIKK